MRILIITKAFLLTYDYFWFIVKRSPIQGIIFEPACNPVCKICGCVSEASLKRKVMCLHVYLL